MSFDPSAIPDLIGRFHPLLLHFPIGLLLWAGIVESIEAIRRQPIPASGPVSLPIVIPGACFSILACVSGWLLANHETPTSALDWHRWLGVSTAVLAVVTAAVGVAMVRGRSVPRNGYRMALFLSVPILAGGGHIGGELKWGDGFIEKGFEKVFYSTAGNSDQGSSSQLAQASIDAPQEERGLRLYHELVRDTLDENCVKCHGPDKTKGKLRLDIPDDLKDLTRETLVIIPGDPDQSLLVELIGLADDDEDRMPPLEESGLSEAQQRGIAEWVRAGAPWPADGPKGPVGPPGIEGPHRLLDEHEVQTPEDDPESPADIFFRNRVQPIFEAHCYECHGPEKQKSGLRLDLREAAMADREFPTIVPGDVDESELIMRLTLADADEDRMPPEGDRLSEEDVAALKSWIESGAHWPDPEISDPVVDSEAVKQRPTRRELTPGKLPDLPRIDVSDDAVRANISKALEALRGIGVRVAPVSQIDDAHEAVFRLLRKQATDESVKLLKGLEQVLTRLDLAGTAVTGASITGLWRFSKLRVLNLSETAITDDDVAILASLPDLTVLNLFGTAVTDDCLGLLERMPSLRRVYLWRTAVTREAARQLARVRPDLLVDNGVASGPRPIQATVKVETSGTWPGRADIAEAHIHDGSVDTIWAVPEADRSGWVQLSLEKPERIVGVRLDEGAFPRIQKFTVEVQKGAEWVELASGTTIGSMKSVLFDSLEGQVFRLKIIEAVETPVIAEFDLLTD
ncbi:MAG: c-type cytochrome domain-containing protein [Planctomycetota bacterium]|nr:c-type cytochrome domain-containing protein [Planctomycetota bacterium]